MLTVGPFLLNISVNIVHDFYAIDFLIAFILSSLEVSIVLQETRLYETRVKTDQSPSLGPPAANGILAMNAVI
jgi:hypothetical protein